MSLEKSVLNETVISDLLSNHYGISSLSVNKLKLGTANCFQVYDGNRYYFLKEFQSDILEEEVVREANLLEYLSGAEFPVTRFYKAENNEFVIKYQDHILCLEEYIEDTPTAITICLPSCFRKSAECLENCIKP